MKKMGLKNPSLTKLGTFKRKSVRLSQEELIKAGPLQAEKSLPLLIQATVEGLDLVTWAESNLEFIESHLLKHGAVLFRNFNMSDTHRFEQFIHTISGELIEYRERSSPRSQVRGNIYTSTEHPADQHIFLHNENSYANTWPLRIFFFCVTPAQQGGETPVADCRRVFKRIDPNIRERFMQKKVMYVRNFGDGLGLNWQTVFQTKDKSEVEAYCRKAGYEFEWKAGNGLRTRRVAPAIVKHPRTGEMLWFNHATFFHVSTLDPTTRKALLAQFEEEDLPNNTYYGDGSAIQPETLAQLRQAYQQETVVFPWQKNDIMMLDNLITAHGRTPFVGERQILTGMANPLSHEDL